MLRDKIESNIAEMSSGWTGTWADTNVSCHIVTIPTHRIFITWHDNHQKILDLSLVTWLTNELGDYVWTNLKISFLDTKQDFTFFNVKLP